MGILAFPVQLCLLQNAIDAGISAKTAVIYLLASSRYPLQVTAAYPVTATVSNKMKHDTVAVRQSQCCIVYLGFGLFGRQTGIEIPRSQHDLPSETHNFLFIFFHGRSHGALVPTVSDKRCGQASVPVRQFEHADLFLHHGQADGFVLLFRHFNETRAFLVQIEAVSGFHPLPLLFIFRLFPCVHAVINMSGHSLHRIDESQAFAYPEMPGEVGYSPDKAVLFPMIGFHAVMNFIPQLQTRPRSNRQIQTFSCK